MNYNLVFYLILSSSIIMTSSAIELDIECDISESHHASQSCSFVSKECTINELSIKNEDTRIVFTNAQEENITSISFHSSHIPTFPKEIFDQFRNVTYVDITVAMMSKIGNNTFEQAMSLMELDLSFNKLTEINEFAFSGLKNLLKLDLSYNDIAMISSKAFNFIEKLEFISLNANKLTALEKDTFKKLTNLRTLYIYSNSIKNLDPQTFYSNQKLITLNLEYNDLEEVELDIEEMQIDNLELTGNSLKKVTLTAINAPKTLNTSPRVRYLHLGHNKFESLSTIIIDKNIKLQKLELPYNNLKVLDDGPNFLTDLTDLTLSENEIEMISQNFMQKLPNLKKLHLHGNKLNLSDNMFEPLKALKYLDLADNKIERVNLNWFRGLSNLTELNLRDNLIESLPIKTLLKDVAPLLKRVIIENNKFNCSYLKSFIEEAKNLTLSELENNGINGIRCSSTSTPGGSKSSQHIYFGVGRRYCSNNCRCFDFI
uniref:CSON009031 protein n=1 Tax=Culicoides sonorensis TaxID=179676 RepID=A0A336LND7_CULSO